MPIGSSCGATKSLAATSEKTINIPPIKAAAGMTYLWSAPTIFLIICGIIKPTKPIEPLTETIEPANNADRITIILRVRLTFMPKTTDVLSPNNIVFIGLCKIIKIKNEATKIVSGVHRYSHFEPANEPIIQKVAFLTPLSVLALNTKKLVKAINIDETAIPTKMSRIGMTPSRVLAMV